MEALTRPSGVIRVLIADDNRAMAHVVRFNLERAGYDVTVARSGLEALTHARHGEFDLVVTDYQMPGLNGEDLCRALREDSRYARTPFVLLSAKGLELDLDRLEEEVGFSAVLFKPFSPKALVDQVAALLLVASTAD